MFMKSTVPKPTELPWAAS